MGIYNSAKSKFGKFLAGLLVKESSGYRPYTPSDFDTLWAVVGTR